MKVLQVNIFGNLSTGRIAVDIYKSLIAHGKEGVIAYARNRIEEGVPSIKIGNRFTVIADGILTRLTDRAGCYSDHSTRKFIEEIKKYSPDIIHLHNIHGYYLNIRILFDFLKEYNKPVVWTLHDCWSFTGHCCYYSISKCNKWKYKCEKCSNLQSYPKSLLIDNSQQNYEMKKRLYSDMDNLYLVTVSKWLYEEVQQSFLKNLPCEVIYNGVDLDQFKPTDNSFKSKNIIGDKFIILGVASTWDKRKRIEDFAKLSEIMDKKKYKIVLVGVDKNTQKQLPSEIKCIERTDNIRELTEIYSAADVYINTSVEETFGLPTVEAMACGTPVIVYNETALPELVNENVGIIANSNDIQSVKRAIEEIQNNKTKYNSVNAESFDKKIWYEKYNELYDRIV